MTRELMWFGTQDYAGWITPPKSGAESSPVAWGADGQFLNGAGYAFNSRNSHKVYNYAWSASSAREEAQRMKNYADGLYGTGKFFFIEPTLYDQNVLPARWAAPVMTSDYEGPSLVPGIVGKSTVASTSTPYNLPVSGMQYAFGSIVQPDIRNAGVFVPIPEGYTAIVTVFGTQDSAGTGGVMVAQSAQGGALVNGTTVKMPFAAPNAGSHQTSFTAATDRKFQYNSPGGGIRIWIGATATGATTTGTITVRGIQVRLFKNGPEADAQTTLPYMGWQGGMGHEGCRMVGKPTFVTHNKINGGQIEYAATFKETLF